MKSRVFPTLPVTSDAAFAVENTLLVGPLFRLMLLVFLCRGRETETPGAVGGTRGHGAGRGPVTHRTGQGWACSCSCGE